MDDTGRRIAFDNGIIVLLFAANGHFNFFYLSFDRHSAESARF
jgi:hypothetical protein